MATVSKRRGHQLFLEYELDIGVDDDDDSDDGGDDDKSAPPPSQAAAVVLQALVQNVANQ